MACQPGKCRYGSIFRNGKNPCKDGCHHPVENSDEMTEGMITVLENGDLREVPDELIRYLDAITLYKWKLFDMRQRFWPENKEETIKIFASAPVGHIFYSATSFDGWQQFEMMIKLLHKLKDKKFKLYLYNRSLCDNLFEFYECKESSLATGGKYDDDVKLREQMKTEMNKLFLEVLTFHEIYWLVSGDGIPLKTIDDISKKRHRFK